MSKHLNREPWESYSGREKMPFWRKALIIVGGIVLISAVVVVVLYNLNLANQPKCGWGDNGGGRPSYTAADVEKGILDDQVVLNSLSDSAYGNEKIFVSAELVDGNGKWNYRQVTVEDGQVYTLRVRVANNGGQTATGTRVAISLPADTATQIPVYGYIFASNAAPSMCWDGIMFTSKKPFRLEYVYGASTLESASLNTVPLGDEIVTKAASENGVAVGCTELDGQVPGGEELFATIQIRVIASETNTQSTLGEPDFITRDAKVRLEGETDWSKSISANPGDLVEFQFHYKNTSTETQQDVGARVTLPEGMELVPGSTKLFNASYQDGANVEQDDVASNGIIIGNYGADADAYVRCTVRITDTAQGEMEIWATTIVNETTAQDSCKVSVGD